VIGLEKLFKNKKALSPVVASIILIAVTVSVSIVVAAWMGTLTFSFTNPTYKIEVTKVEFPVRNIISLTVNNIGTGWIEIGGVYVNNDWETITSPQLPLSLDAGSIAVLNITYTWTPQYNYQVKLSLYTGGDFIYYYKDAVAPAG
jgi:flagellin-like protein